MLGLCWMRPVPFVPSRCPVVGVPGVVLVLAGVFDGLRCPQREASTQIKSSMSAYIIEVWTPSKHGKIMIPEAREKAEKRGISNCMLCHAFI